ncbi:TPA: hypothetical protein NJ244_003197 [Vibrio parahaemolyticus]|nr:hypothetical protein [Vibrio parahaemolyticus]
MTNIKSYGVTKAQSLMKMISSLQSTTVGTVSPSPTNQIMVKVEYNP